MTSQGGFFMHPVIVSGSFPKITPPCIHQQIQNTIKMKRPSHAERHVRQNLRSTATVRYIISAHVFWSVTYLYYHHVTSGPLAQPCPLVSQDLGRIEACDSLYQATLHSLKLSLVGVWLTGAPTVGVVEREAGAEHWGGCRELGAAAAAAWLFVFWVALGSGSWIEEGEFAVETGFDAVEGVDGCEIWVIWCVHECTVGVYCFCLVWGGWWMAAEMRIGLWRDDGVNVVARICLLFGMKLMVHEGWMQRRSEQICAVFDTSTWVKLCLRCCEGPVSFSCFESVVGWAARLNKGLV